MLRNLFKLLSIIGWARAVSKGPGAMGKRYARRKAHRVIP